MAVSHGQWVVMPPIGNNEYTCIIEYYLEGVNEGQQSATAWASSTCNENVVAQHRIKKRNRVLIHFIILPLCILRKPNQFTKYI